MKQSKNKQYQKKVNKKMKHFWQSVMWFYPKLKYFLFHGMPYIIKAGRQEEWLEIILNMLAVKQALIILDCTLSVKKSC